ncbi:hypothetical protein C8J56DRAFT_173153 [Mycena floridula]|nr:hypothetical protein C8J56DRAFT_173153 [Mycena floridula]
MFFFSLPFRPIYLLLCSSILSILAGIIRSSDVISVKAFCHATAVRYAILEARKLEESPPAVLEGNSLSDMWNRLLIRVSASLTYCSFRDEILQILSEMDPRGRTLWSRFNKFFVVS